MRVLVTQGDIDGGSRYQPCDCPVALAIRRELWSERPSVTVEEIILENSSRIISFPTPAAVVAFVRDFDCGRPVLPFEFELPSGEELA